MHISMPGYVKKALGLFGHQVLKHPQHEPHKHTIPTYGATIQYTKAEDKSRPLAIDEKKYIQQVIGTFLYYGQAVDPTMLTSLSTIASTQAEPTKDTIIKTHVSLTKRPPTKMQSSPTEPAIWYLPNTVMLHTSVNLRRTVKQEAIFSCHPTPRTLATMVQF